MCYKINGTKCKQVIDSLIGSEAMKRTQAKGIKRKIKIALNNVDSRISGFARQGGPFARALASEGYNGGFRAALLDVLLLIDGNDPCVNRELWRKPPPSEPQQK